MNCECCHKELPTRNGVVIHTHGLCCMCLGEGDHYVPGMCFNDSIVIKGTYEITDATKHICKECGKLFKDKYYLEPDSYKGHI